MVSTNITKTENKAKVLNIITQKKQKTIKIKYSKVIKKSWLESVHLVQ